LTVDQYRSLLINTGGTALTRTGGTAGVQQAGGGLLDVTAALNATATAYPATLGFGAGSADGQLSQVVTITNIGAGKETYTIATAPRVDGPAPAAAIGTLDLEAGASADVPVAWTFSGLTPGTYEGFITVTAASSGAAIKVPYWYAETESIPAAIKTLSSTSSGRRGRMLRDAVLFRVTDGSGVPVVSQAPNVTVLTGGGSVVGVYSYDAQVPGVFGIDVQLGFAPGTNVFRIQAGDVFVDITISGY
jgi:hypothetical protein